MVVLLLTNMGNVVGVAVAFIRAEKVGGFNFGIKSSVLRTFSSANSIKLSEPNKEILEN